jgi:hypothetical protein
MVSALWLAPAHAADTSNKAYLLNNGDNDKYRLDSKYRPPSETKSRKSEAVDAIFVPTPGVHTQLSSRPYAKEIAKAAHAASLDPALVHAVIFVESHYRHKAISDKGAIGLMQVIPDTGARYGIYNLEDSPQSNLRAGTLYLRDLLRMFNNRLDLALAAYNAGEGAVIRYANRIPPYRETQLYVRAVLAKYNEWRSYTLASDNSRDDAPDAMLKAEPERLEYLAGTQLKASRPLFAPTY